MTSIRIKKFSFCLSLMTKVCGGGEGGRGGFKTLIQGFMKEKGI